MQAGNPGVEFLLFLIEIFSIFLFFSLLFIYFGNIKQLIKDVFENRAARKSAKKLGLVDKGVMPSQSIIIKINPDGSTIETKRRWVHSFCGRTVRIGVLESTPVKWCSLCECLLSEEDDNNEGDDGEDDDSPKLPPSLEITKSTNDAIERAKNGVIRS